MTAYQQVSRWVRRLPTTGRTAADFTDRRPSVTLQRVGARLDQAEVQAHELAELVRQAKGRRNGR